jgi:hypothetical protein
LSTGEVDMSEGGEFSLDLKAICDEATSGTVDGVLLFEQDLYQFYIRVVALDEKGNCIGDPGTGLSFCYGAADIIADVNSINLSQTSNIAVLIEQPYYYEWEWRRVSPDILNRDLSYTSERVMFSAINGAQDASEIIKKAVRIEVQIATSPFSNAIAQNFEEPEGLVYRDLDTEPDIYESDNGFTYLTDWYHGIVYKDFVPTKEVLDAMGGIYYYVRAVFYVPDSENPSVLRPRPSETMTIAFRVTSAQQNQAQEIVVKSNIPLTKFVRYVPVQWSTYHYEEYFEVTRHIEAEEMNFSIKITQPENSFCPIPSTVINTAGRVSSIRRCLMKCFPSAQVSTTSNRNPASGMIFSIFWKTYILQYRKPLRMLKVPLSRLLSIIFRLSAMMHANCSKKPHVMRWITDLCISGYHRTCRISTSLRMAELIIALNMRLPKHSIKREFRLIVQLRRKCRTKYAPISANG